MKKRIWSILLTLALLLTLLPAGAAAEELADPALSEEDAYAAEDGEESGVSALDSSIIIGSSDIIVTGDKDTLTLEGDGNYTATFAAYDRDSTLIPADEVDWSYTIDFDKDNHILWFDPGDITLKDGILTVDGGNIGYVMLYENIDSFDCTVTTALKSDPSKQGSTTITIVKAPTRLYMTLYRNGSFYDSRTNELHLPETWAIPEDGTIEYVYRVEFHTQFKDSLVWGLVPEVSIVPRDDGEMDPNVHVEIQPGSSEYSYPELIVTVGSDAQSDRTYDLEVSYTGPDCNNGEKLYVWMEVMTHHVDITWPTVTIHPEKAIYGNNRDSFLELGDDGSVQIGGEKVEGSFLIYEDGACISPYYSLYFRSNDGRYRMHGENVSITIKPRPVTVKAEDAVMPYGGELPPFTYTVPSELEFLSFDIRYTLEVKFRTDATSSSDAGPYEIIPSVETKKAGNPYTIEYYDITLENGTLTITPKDISDSETETVIGDIEDQLYTGSEVQPEPTVTVDGQTLAKGTDYTLSYENNIQAGASATVTVTGKGNYTGSVSKTFQIIDDGPEVPPDEDADSIVYGETVEVQVTVQQAGQAPDGNEVALFNSDGKQVSEAKPVAIGTAMTFQVEATKDNGLTPENSPCTLSLKYTENGEVAVGETNVALTIAQKPVTVTVSGSATKTFDNTTAVAGADSLTLTADGVLAGENVVITGGVFAYDDANAGAGKTITASEFALSGTDAGNYKLKSASASAPVGEITKATRVVSLLSDTLLLIPDKLEDTISVSVSSDLDMSASANMDYTVDGDLMAISLNKDSGKVTAQGNGAATVTVQVKETGNYAASNAVSVTVTAITEPVLKITGVSSNTAADILRGTLKDGKVIVNGLMTEGTEIAGITAETFPGVTVSVSGTSLVAVYNGSTIAAYPIDTTGVSKLNASIVFSEQETVGKNEVTGDQAATANVAVTSSETKVEGLLAAAAQDLQSVAEKLEEQYQDAISKELAPSEDDGYTIKVETNVEITAKELTTESFRLEITPTYTVTAVSNVDPTKTIALTENEKLDNTYIKVPVTVSVKLPDGFPTTNLYVRHVLSNGDIEILRVTVDSNNVASWEQSSFSEAEIFQDKGSVTATFAYENGTVSYQTYDIVNLGEALPTDSKSGYIFDGWQISGSDAVYTTVSQEFLAAVRNGGTLTAKFTKDQEQEDPTKPENPGQKPGGESSGSSGSGSSSSGSGSSSSGSGSSSSGSGSSSSGSGSSGGYSILVPSRITGGAVSVRPISASEGNKVTITPKPNSGYEVGTVTVTDKDGKQITVTDAGDGKYTFIMPNSKVDVNVEFVRTQTTPSAPSFTDVQSGTYYYDAVQWAVDQSITAGTTATTFSPDVSCTRAQIVTFLWRAAGSPKVNGNNPFADVQPSAYYYDAVLWAIEQGITAGTTSTTFSPDDTCTRAQAVTFLYRAAGSPIVSGTNNFTDVDSNSYYVPAVQWAVEKGVTAGTSETTFSPNSDCTRGQIVTFLYRDRTN